MKVSLLQILSAMPSYLKGCRMLTRVKKGGFHPPLQLITLHDRLSYSNTSKRNSKVHRRY
jgi:hypothetical protein